jgi:phosphoglycolate phosphatase
MNGHHAVPVSSDEATMLPFSTFLLDLDGTLVDHFAAIHRAHAYTMQRLGLPAPTMAEVHGAVGGGVELAIARLVGPDRVTEALAIYRPYWDATMLDDVKLLPGSRELLEALHSAGAAIAVFTNKNGPSSRRICDHLGIRPYLRGVFGATDTPWLKPQTEFTDFALQQLGVTSAGAMVVGDSPWDVDAAKKSGLTSWCVTTGTHAADQLALAGADQIFPSLLELRTALGC